MRCRLVLSVICGLGVFTTAGAPSAEAQELAMARPRFIATWVRAGEPSDASQSAVLQRRVTLDVSDVPVSVALREIVKRARLDMSYDRSVLPVGRVVSLHARDITVVSALTEVLLNAGLDVSVGRGGELGLVRRALTVAVVPTGSIVGRVTDAKTQTALSGATVLVLGTGRGATTGSDGRYRIADVAPGTYTVRARYIGYAPGSASVTVSADQEATADFSLEKSAQRLDEVVTTGTVVPTEVKALPTPISVISADDIQRLNLQRVEQVFRGEVPGVIAWDAGPTANYTTDLYVRGASTLAGVHSIKTFIDGVEVVEPYYLGTIDPNSIDRIEITRGPQASTLYGAGALGGVMQIFTKKGRLGLSRPELTAKISAGGVGGFDGQSTAFRTDDAVAIQGGGQNTSYNLGGSYRHTGEWVPSWVSTDWGISAGGRTTQGPFTLSSFASYANRASDFPWDTRFQSYVPLSRPRYTTLGMKQQTYGATASVQATRSWQHTLTLGYDQNYDAQEQTRPRFTTPADSFLFAFVQHEAKTSLLYHTDLSLRFGPVVAATVTAGVNYEAFDYDASARFNATVVAGGEANGSTVASHLPSTNTGYFGQVQIGLAERLFLTGGLRAERNPYFGAGFGTAWSPRVGAAYVLGLGPASLKLRASYGESIRAPSNGQRDAVVTPFQIQLANTVLAPERQRGADGGVEIYLGRASLGVTYYNQRAIDLIEPVSIVTAPGTVHTYQYQNVSQVKNEGWELEGHFPLGPVQVAATYSIMHSTVQQLSPGYGGDYQVGDQVLGVPRTSAGASVTYSPIPRTTLIASMTHIGYWINYDNIALDATFYGGQPFLGSYRAYWIEYPTVTKFAVGVSQVLTNGLTAFVRAENVGNTLRAEQINDNIPTTRSVMIGANVRY